MTGPELQIDKKGQLPELLQHADREHLLRVVQMFVRVEEILDSVYDLNRLLELIMRESERVVDAETSSLLLFDPQTNELFFEVALGPKGEQVKKIRLPLNEQSIAGAAGIHRCPINIQDVNKDPRWNKQVDQQTQFNTRNLLAVPMLRQERLIGVIEVLNKKTGDCFTDSDITILSILASIAAIALENAQLYLKNIQAERLAALGQAVGGISHYIKNVLTGMKGSISLIESAVRDKEYDILDRAVMVMQRSYGRISDLVKEMLSYCRGRIPEPAPNSIHVMFSEMQEMMSESADRNDIDLVTELPDEDSWVMIDREVLERVVLNLITNAMESVLEHAQIYTDLKGKVTVRVSHKNEWLSVEVEDNGVGIPEQNLAKIWAPFWSTKGSSGTGLGLASSRKLVEDSHGTLEVFSQEGKGARFVLKLPAPLVAPPGADL